MSAQTIESQILRSLPLLELDQKKSVLSVIKSFLKNKEALAQLITIEQYNKEIDEAMARVKNGEFYSQEEVEEMAKKW